MPRSLSAGLQAGRQVCLLLLKMQKRRVNLHTSPDSGGKQKNTMPPSEDMAENKTQIDQAVIFTCYLVLVGRFMYGVYIAQVLVPEK
jgi:hypothetical protein